ncbi:hypothetical protein [Collinsella sp. HCP28S3_F2]
MSNAVPTVKPMSAGVVFLIIAYPLSVSCLVFFVLLMISAFTGESVTVG